MYIYLCVLIKLKAESKMSDWANLRANDFYIDGYAFPLAGQRSHETQTGCQIVSTHDQS